MKFIKITKAGFYESMVHSVEMTQTSIINYDKKFHKNYINFIFFT